MSERTNKPLVNCFEDDLGAVVDVYRGQGLTVAEALGALHLVQARITLALLAPKEDDG